MRSVSIADVVKRFVAEHGLDRRRSVEALFDRWDEIIGPPESEMAAPLSLNDGTLVVVVANSTIASEASFSQSVYLERVNRYLGSNAARTMRVRVATGREKEMLKRSKETDAPREDAEPFHPEAVNLSAQELEWVEETTAHLRNEATRARFRRTLIARLKREKWDARNQVD